ncbi:forkhead box protein E3-like, partial [Zerene cesonia]|uniref:forkhead box protein E3-like n=1 Tax=Zerene cesonia TaxID=33412 RepID=UPI0018E51A0A
MNMRLSLHIAVVLLSVYHTCAERQPRAIPNPSQNYAVLGEPIAANLDEDGYFYPKPKIPFPPPPTPSPTAPPPPPPT